MKFYITGAGGFIGSALCQKLTEAGHEVIKLGRDTKTWPVFEGNYGVINLAGRSIFGRFSTKVKQEIYDSRINTTKNIIEAIKKAPQKAQVVVSASAVGYYGDCGDELLDETAKPGQDFLANVCKDWESTINQGCLNLGVRCINIRTGYVLGRGGMLKTLLPIFKLGLGGKLSTGKQYMPWISHDDIVSLYIFSATNPNCTGPINASAPQSITNLDFTKTLAKLLHRPAFFTVPKFALKLLFGEFGELMLYSQKTSVKKLLDLGFKFKHQNLEQCLKQYLS